MNKEKYLEMRNALMAEIEAFIAEGEIEESNAKMEEVKTLDNKWEEIKLANANLNALKDNTKATNIENKSINPGEVKIVDSIIENKVVDNKASYEIAWAKFLQGNKLEGNDLEIFNKVNKLENAFTHTTVNTP
jgi:hypothetical protein